MAASITAAGAVAYAIFASDQVQNWETEPEHGEGTSVRYVGKRSATIRFDRCVWFCDKPLRTRGNFHHICI